MSDKVEEIKRDFRDWIDSLPDEAHIANEDIDRLETIFYRLTARLHEVYEIYAGMEGFIPETAPEGYCLSIIKKMASAAKGE